jgi:hypothetical protein
MDKGGKVTDGAGGTASSSSAPQRGLLPRHEAATDKAASAARPWPSAETSGYTSRATGR